MADLRGGQHAWASDASECGETDVIADIAAPLWVEEGDSHVLTASTEVLWTHEVTFQLRFGALAYEWTQEDVLSDLDGQLTVDPAPPADAFLHALAADYVSDLTVRVVAHDALGRGQQVFIAPKAYVAWPDGEHGDPVVWDEAAMVVEAPLGILDTQLRAEFDGQEVSRVLPPARASTRPPREDEVDVAAE